MGSSSLIALLLLSITQVDSHGAVVKPPPRNAVDKDLAPWNGPVPQHPPNVESKTGWCPVPGSDGKPSGQNGQSCFWFSNGCAVGCPRCDGNSRGPIPGANEQHATDPPTGTGRNKVGPNGVVCNASERTAAKPTMCDPKHRSINQQAACGGDHDWYYYSPWRAPGYAPVMDPCGVAGGHHPPDGAFGGIYVNTSHAKLGDNGTQVLPYSPSNTTWQPGEVVEVTWTIEANHAGGYQYRLAQRTQEPLTEADFQKLPLRFVKKQGLRWGGGPQHGGKEIFFDGMYVTDGVQPRGSAWAKVPIPLLGGQAGTPGPVGVPWFTPPCNDTWCTGGVDGDTALPNLEIVDYVQIPMDLQEGEWVLGWRWDAEQSNQIWQSCSDVTIKAQ